MSPLRKITLVILLLLVALTRPLVAVAVGTAVHTSANLGGGVMKHSVAWTSDASGDVSGNPFTVGRGWVLGVKFVPGTGADAPTTLYDVTIADTDAVDVSRGAGANLSATVATITAAPAVAFFEGGAIDVVVANAGAANKGTVVFYIGQNNNSN